MESDYWIAHLTVDRAGRDASGPHLPQDVLAIELRRRVGNGMAEQISVRNHSMAPAEVDLRLELDGDFADVSEKDGGPSHRGTTTRT